MIFSNGTMLLVSDKSESVNECTPTVHKCVNKITIHELCSLAVLLAANLSQQQASAQQQPADTVRVVHTDVSCSFDTSAHNTVISTLR